MCQDLKISNRTLTPQDSNVSSNFVLPASSSSGFSTTSAARVYITSSTGYYNYYAATAGTGHEGMTSTVPSSICPKGWRLPTGGSGGEQEKLAKSYGSGEDDATRNALLTQPVPGYTINGGWSGSSIYLSTTSVYWSSTLASSYSYNRAIHLAFTYWGPVTTTKGGTCLDEGWEIRCIKD